MCASLVMVSPVFFGAHLPEADVSQIPGGWEWDFGPINSMIEKVAVSFSHLDVKKDSYLHPHEGNTQELA